MNEQTKEKCILKGNNKTFKSQKGCTMSWLAFPFDDI